MKTSDSARRDFLRTVVVGTTALCLSSRGSAQTTGQAAPPPTPIRPTKLTDTLVVLIGDGGNVGLVISDDGLMMIDGGLPERANDMIKALAAVSPLKVQRLFNTHFHFDHIGSNETLGKTGTKIMAHENVKKLLSIRFNDEAFGRIFEPLKPEGLPVETFTAGGELTFGKDKLVYAHIPEAHTDGDSYVFFPEANILHTGDLFWNHMYPVIDYSAKGWIGGMVAACDKMDKVGDAGTRVIPGHGEIGTKAELKAFRDMLATVQERLEPMAKQGRQIDEVLAAAPTKDLDEKWAKPRPAEAFLRQAYPSIIHHNQNA